MASLNKTILLGNLTRNPETRNTQSGMVIADFGLAVNERTKNGDKTLFVDVKCFGKLAEIVSQYCNKGKQVVVDGRLAMDQWDDKQTGQKRSKMYVVADQVVFFGGKEHRQAQGPVPGEYKSQRYQDEHPPQKQMTNGTPDDAEEIPF